MRVPSTPDVPPPAALPDRAPADELTVLLRAWSDGDAAALDALLPLVYDELHDLAAHALRRERAGHTLQPTALVHEAYLRLVDQQDDVAWASRTHFYGVAARLIRQVLVDAARTRDAAKRGGGAQRLTLDAAATLAAGEGGPTDTVDLLALDDALQRLAVLDPLQARVVELRYFAGLSIEETAQALDISPATVKREWAVARGWLRGVLAP